MKYIIIGAGASGIACAINLKRKGKDVTLIEKNDKLGKKLLLTGNGRCNYFNSDFNHLKYVTKDYDNLKQIINEDNKNKLLNFFDYIGIKPKIVDSYYYPYSNKSESFLFCLLSTLKELNVDIKYDYNVTKIEKDKKTNKFKIYSDSSFLECDKLVLSTGSLSYPKTGSTGDGFRFLKDLGFDSLNITPALTSLNTNDKILTLEKIRTPIEASLYIDDKLIHEEKGELQINKDNISGICILNLSNYYVLNGMKKNSYIFINFLSLLGVTKENYNKFFTDLANCTVKKTIKDILDGILNYKLTNYILKKSNISLDKNYFDLSDQEFKTLKNNLISYKIIITGVGDIEKAQTTYGGVHLCDINTYNMELKKISNLYLTGELLEPSGICGGYNLAFSFITGLLVGEEND